MQMLFNLAFAFKKSQVPVIQIIHTYLCTQNIGSYVNKHRTFKGTLNNKADETVISELSIDGLG